MLLRPLALPLIAVLAAALIGTLQSALGDNAFDALHFHPASRSHYIGPESYEKKWLQCMQELQELRQKESAGSSEEKEEDSPSEESYGVTHGEGEDSDEKNFPPNYKPAFHYERLHISDIIYPLKLHKVPNYPMKSYGGYVPSGYKRTDSHPIAGGYGSSRGGKKYGQNEEKPFGYGHSERGNGRKEAVQEKQYGGGEEKEMPKYEKEGHQGKMQEQEYSQQLEHKPAHQKEEKKPRKYVEEVGRGSDEHGKMPESGQEERHEEEGSDDEEEEESQERQGHSDLSRLNRSEEPYASSEEEEEEEGGEAYGSHRESGEGRYDEEESASEERYASEDEGEERRGAYGSSREGGGGYEERGREESHSRERPSKGDRGHRRQPASPQAQPFQGQQPQPGNMPIPQRPPSDVPEQQPAPAFQPQPQTGQMPQTVGGLGIPQQSLAPNPDLQLPQIPAPLQVGEQQQPSPALANNQAAPQEDANCRLEALDVCGARAKCPENGIQVQKDCSLEGDDLIFDAATQDCKSIAGVPECQRDPFCSGKALGWTPVGSQQCTKVAYMCAVPSASTVGDQQQNKQLLCQGSTVVNPANPSECIERTMVAGC